MKKSEGMKKSVERKKRARKDAEEQLAKSRGGEERQVPSPMCEGDAWRIHGALLRARTALLTYDCRFPAPEGEGGYARICEFYRRLCEASAAYLAERLFPATLADYGSCADARARYAFARVRYLADFTVTQDGDGFFSVRRCVRILRGGREEAQWEEGEVFLLARGLLCPIRFLRANGCEFAEKERISRHTGTHLFPFLRFLQRKPRGEFYLSDNKIHPLPSPKRSSR